MINGASHKTYGIPRIHAKLKAEGVGDRPETRGSGDERRQPR